MATTKKYTSPLANIASAVSTLFKPTSTGITKNDTSYYNLTPTNPTYTTTPTTVMNIGNALSSTFSGSGTTGSNTTKNGNSNTYYSNGLVTPVPTPTTSTVAKTPSSSTGSTGSTGSKPINGNLAVGLLNGAVQPKNEEQQVLANIGASYTPVTSVPQVPTVNLGGGGFSISPYGGGGYPEYAGYDPYNSKYAQQIQDALDKMLNRAEFSYDYLSDPSYQQYAKQYAIQGQNAMQDTMGEYSALTGGLPSSYAVTAGQQALNSYNTALNNVIPQLREARYGRYMDNYKTDLQNLQSLQSLDNDAYSQFASDRNFDMNKYQTNLQKYLEDRNYDLNVQQLQMQRANQARSRDLQAQQLQYSLQRAREERAQAEWERQFREKELQAKYGQNLDRLFSRR